MPVPVTQTGPSAAASHADRPCGTVSRRRCRADLDLTLDGHQHLRAVVGDFTSLRPGSNRESRNSAAGVG